MAEVPDASRRRIDYLALEEICGALRNPKRHASVDIQASIGRFGYTEPLVIDERTGRLVSGHGRTDALRALYEAGGPAPDGIEVRPDGRWAVPVVLGWSSRDDAEAEAFLVAANRLTQLGGWDAGELVEVLEALEQGAGFAGVGYSAEDLAELRRLLERKEKRALTEPDSVPAKPKKARARLGDVYLLGEHRLACGDSTDAEVVARALGGRTIDLVFTDPPYGVVYEGKTKDRLTIVNDDLGHGPLTDLLDSAFRLAVEHCRPGAVWYVTGPAGPIGHIFGSVLGRLGIWRQTLVWVKDRFVLGHNDFHYRHELLYEGSAPEPAGPDDDAGYEDIRFGWIPGVAHRQPTNRRQDTVWEIPRPAASREHPTMKPVELMRRAMEVSSAPGEVVYDAFAGSGSTLIAAYGSDRTFCGVELDPRYVDVICRRFEEHTGITPVLEGKGARSFLDTKEETA